MRAAHSRLLKKFMLSFTGCIPVNTSNVPWALVPIYKDQVTVLGFYGTITFQRWEEEDEKPTKLGKFSLEHVVTHSTPV